MVSPRIAYRYAFSKSNRHRSASLIIMLGLAIGMMALITLLALMNSLQSDLLDQVKSIESFHLQLSLTTAEVEIDEISAEILNLEGIEQVYPHVNTQVMVGSNSTSSTGRLRVVDEAIWWEENPFKEHLFLIDGRPPHGEEEVALSSTMAYRLGARLGDEIPITVLVPGRTAPLAPVTLTFRVSGLFSTSLSEFDESTLITSSEPLLERIGLKRITFGLYLKGGAINKSKGVVNQLKELYPEGEVKSWQQLNSAFYSALTLEKAMMYLFLSFMFFILGVNMKSATSRLLFVKQRELAILRAVGAPKKSSLQIFILQSLFITSLGLALGVAAGLLLSSNIGVVFDFFNKVQYLFTRRFSYLLAYPFTIKIEPLEIGIVALLILGLSLLFTYLGCRGLLKREPMELLYHE
jgi:lipoprotein-releasing system permease protein